MDDPITFTTAGASTKVHVPDLDQNCPNKAASPNHGTKPSPVDHHRLWVKRTKPSGHKAIP
ncbi:MAG: hypothetical protein EBR29_00130 [Sphingobacteriia bacterium]|nr:hypothetical protein [Sphingobacteriia bacterium]